MKALICSLIMTITATNLFAQTNNKSVVTEKVKTAFVKLFPDVKEEKWSGNNYTTNAMFIKNGKQIVAMFKADTLFSTVEQTDYSIFPEAVKKHFEIKYKNYKKLQTGKIHFVSKPDIINVCYGADVSNGKEYKRVICYPDGNEMSVSSMPTPKK